MQELQASRQLQVSTAVSVLSIAAFNYCGISVTKHLSGAARATIDACRTLFIWAFSLSVRSAAEMQPVLTQTGPGADNMALQVGWERFHALEV